MYCFPWVTVVEQETMGSIHVMGILQNHEILVWVMSGTTQPIRSIGCLVGRYESSPSEIRRQCR